MRQFTDDKMKTLKDTFSIKAEDVDGVRGMLESMAKDLAASFPQGLKKNASQQNSNEAAALLQAQASGPSAQPPSQNVTNVDKANQQQTAKHARSGSKSGQPPPPPTTTQPPFQFGAQSPAGQPTYIGKPMVTQDNLQLPAKKRARTGTSSGPGSGAQSNNSSPQVQKQPSPEMVKKAAPNEVKPLPKPRFPCTESGCEAGTIGFQTEEARQQHVEEEHVKPNLDPSKYATDNLAAALGLELDPQGRPTSKLVQGANGTQSPAALATNELGKQTHTPNSTSMSRSSSMMRQGSAAGAKGSDLIKNIAAKAGTPKSSPAMSMAEGVKPDSKLVPQGLDQAWSMATIDPQDLFQSMGILESGGGGAISDMAVYRSITPNDTPESSTSKESATSEPNSDVSEGVALNVTLDMGFDTWRPFEGDQYLNTGTTDVDLMMSMDQGGMNDTMFSDFTWDEMPSFPKSFPLDSSQYSLDTTTLDSAI